jgi:hypothetical protein
MAIDLCASIGKNTGRIRCDRKRGVPAKPILGNKVFTPSDQTNETTLVAAIMAAINLDSTNANKLYPIPGTIKDVTPITEADVTGKLAFGPTRRLRKGNPGYNYTLELSHTEYQNILAFDGIEVPVITLDRKYDGWFYEDEATGNISGEMAYVTFSGNGFEDGKAIETGVCIMTVAYLDVDDFERRSAYFTFKNVTANDFKGLNDVNLVEFQAHASNVYKIGFKIQTAKVGGDLNIWDESGAAIVALTFTASTSAGALTLTSVAADNTLKCGTFTFDNTAFTALAPGTAITVQPPSVATLIAAGITGIELLPITVTK